MAADLGVTLPADAPVVTVVAVGAIVPEAVEAVRQLVREEIAASLVVVTSADRLSAELAGRRLASIRDRSAVALPHLGTLFPIRHTPAPMVTVHRWRVAHAGLPGRRVRGARRAAGHGPVRAVGHHPRPVRVRRHRHRPHRGGRARRPGVVGHGLQAFQRQRHPLARGRAGPALASSHLACTHDVWRASRASRVSFVHAVHAGSTGSERTTEPLAHAWAGPPDA